MNLEINIQNDLFAVNVVLAQRVKIRTVSLLLCTISKAEGRSAGSTTVAPRLLMVAIALLKAIPMLGSLPAIQSG